MFILLFVFLHSDALREFKDEDEAILKVSSKYVLKVKYHKTYKNLVLFKYSQRDSDFKVQTLILFALFYSLLLIPYRL
jgi:hypothetical protein